MNQVTQLPSLLKTPPSQIVDDILVYNNPEYNSWFEDQYQNTQEPWDYSRRGGERYRHNYTVQKIKQYNKRPERILELGCSKGLMTVQLPEFAREVYAADISLSAVKSCKAKCDPIAKKNGCSMHYMVASAPDLPFEDETFDVVMLCDGLIGWWFTEKQMKDTLQEAHRIVKKGGHVILTDFAVPEQFASHTELVRKSPLKVVEVSYIYDRLWYLMESFAKRTQTERLLSKPLASISVAKLLASVSSSFGPKASRHLMIVAQKA